MYKEHLKQNVLPLCSTFIFFTYCHFDLFVSLCFCTFCFLIGHFIFQSLFIDLYMPRFFLFLSYSGEELASKTFPCLVIFIELCKITTSFLQLFFRNTVETPTQHTTRFITSLHHSHYYYFMIHLLIARMWFRFIIYQPFIFIILRMWGFSSSRNSRNFYRRFCWGKKREKTENKWKVQNESI